MLNLQINAISFNDQNISNNPLVRNFDVQYKLFGLPFGQSEQKNFIIPPGLEQVVYDSARSTSMDSTTAFTVTKPYINKNIFRFTHSSGTAPVFRIDRNIGITTSTQFSVTVNGPVVTFTLAGGPFNTTNIQVGDTLLVLDGAGASAGNQGRFTIISKTTNSISIQNLNAVAETFTIASVNNFLVFSSGGGSANQPQIGDKLLISGGFSLASHGVYEIVEVTPSWIEVLVGLPKGLALETNIAPGTSNFIIYQAVSQFVLVAAQSPIVVRFNNNTDNSIVVEPLEMNNPEKPGVLCKMGSFYKLTLVNNGIYPAPVLIALAK